ncbi:hypothetical protein CYMTET_12408 [Cymbomonas tetramitiformis]|uniref:Uncharacterized protein n=1 Tax=Cymbomonas tetramitiformis TaxID=36881 RepID=A0AAE0GKH6_9CHLO|nr:hypothetical protein CYMTET_12408 [Cymbomonas tetramitiformis]
MDNNAASTYLLNALPPHFAGVVRERLALTLGGHEEYTLEQVTEVSQQAFNDLKAFHERLLRNSLDNRNLHGNV